MRSEHFPICSSLISVFARGENSVGSCANEWAVNLRLVAFEAAGTWTSTSTYPLSVFF